MTSTLCDASNNSSSFLPLNMVQLMAMKRHHYVNCTLVIIFLDVCTIDVHINAIKKGIRIRYFSDDFLDVCTIDVHINAIKNGIRIRYLSDDIFGRLYNRCAHQRY
ncbi:uncharacterized protein LOC120359144 [Solenopsis invicta]|uniref:uncharacterized protein LOC120359144 n=1 Tax=Solenopsis invicta TaxID=13686 RepID=UPI00193DA0BE|nr:uncharacterized protein LOC120359144 [Solenopsis invicta]